MFSLPEPPGPYSVGATSFTLPVRPARRIGTSQIRQDVPELEPALVLEEVAFTAYYPVDPSAKKSKGRLEWLMRPLRDSVHGYSHFTGISKWILWPIVYLFASRVKIPAYTNTPPLRPPAFNHSIPNRAPRTPSDAWPLVIFSHGLGGGRTTYSQICTNLASSGKVVLSLEHRDGTSPVCRVGSAHGKARTRLYINPEHVIWENKDVPIARLALREEQLDFRRRELYHAYTAFRKLTCKSERGALQTMDGALIDWSAWMPSDSESWVRCESCVALAGHSFGGATVFSVLSNPPPEPESIIQIPVSHAIALDPWLEPLAYPGPAPISADDTPALHTKLLVINAEGFTLWKDHYARLQEVVPAWHGSYVLTMVGARHVSFSDFPVMLPRIIRDPAAHRIIGVINELVLAFVDDRLKAALDAPSVPTRKMGIQVDEPSWWSKKGDRRLVGQPGDVIVH